MVGQIAYKNEMGYSIKAVAHSYDWRARHDSNVRTTASKKETLGLPNLLKTLYLIDITV